jgi:integrase
MARQKQRDERIKDVLGKSGQVVSYNARFEYVDPATGKRRQRPRRFKTVELAEAYLAAQDEAHRRGRLLEPSKEPLGRALDRFLRAKQISEATLDRYFGLTESVYGYIFGLPLSELKAEHFEECHRLERERGKNHGASLQKAYDRLNEFCGRMVERGAMRANPLEHVERPGNDSQPDVLWSREQWHRFRESEQGEDLYLFWLLLYENKARLGEVQAMRWCDLDLEHAPWHAVIVKSITRKIDPITKRAYYAVGDRPKTKSGNRRIFFSDQMAALLRARRDRVRFERRVLGLEWDEEAFVFAGETKEGFMQQCSIGRWLRKACQRAGLRPELTPKGLRATGATHAAAANEPFPMLMAEMGHVNPRSTMVYVRPSDADRARWANLMAAEIHGEERVREVLTKVSQLPTFQDVSADASE